MSTLTENEKSKRYLIWSLICWFGIALMVCADLYYTGRLYSDNKSTTDIEVVDLTKKLNIEKFKSEDAVRANRAILMLVEVAYKSDTTVFTPYQKHVFNSLMENKIAVQDMKTLLAWYDKLSPTEKSLVRPNHTKEASVSAKK